MVTTPQVIDLLTRADPLFQFKWVSKLSTLPFGLPGNFIESVDLPFNNIGVGETIFGGGGFDLFPGSHTLGTVNFVFYEDQLCSTMKWITLWKSKVKDFSSGFYNLPGDGSLTSTGYKQQIDVSMLNTKNEAILDVQLIGLWPEATSNWSLNYTDDGRLTVSQAFAVDAQNLIFK